MSAPPEVRGEPVGSAADFGEGTVRLVHVGRREIAVARLDGHLFAVNNRCPHMSGPLVFGHLGPRMESPTPGVCVADAQRPVLACAWHGWEFDLHTGRAVDDPATRVRTYAVSVVDDTVYIDAATPAATR